MPARTLAAVGTALTTFLAVSALTTQLLVTRVAVSAFVGVPVGLFAAAAIGWLTFTRFWSDPDQRPSLAGGAAIGYTVLALSGVRYVWVDARDALPLDTLLGVAGAVGVAVFLLVWLAPDRFDGEESGVGGSGETGESGGSGDGGDGGE